MNNILKTIMLATTLLLLVSISLTSQTTTTPTTNPGSSPSNAGVPGQTSTQTGVLPTEGGLLNGRWVVDKAIYDYLGALKQVEAGSDQFYVELSFGAGGKGTIVYGKSSQTVPMEYALRNNQDLTIAFGSLLKPQTDLYRVVFLNDGSIFLRSTRIALASGTIFYFLRRVP